MGNFATLILNCDSRNPAFLDSFRSSEASICSIMAFLPLGNFNHIVVSASIDFSSNSQQDALFHWITYEYSHVDWDGLHNHLRDVSSKDVFELLLLLVNFVSGLRLELMYLSLFLSIRSSLTHLHGFQLLMLFP